MRNLKKFLALVLAMLMVVSAAATVSAFDDVTEEHDFYVAIQDLVGKEIVQGKDENTFDPDGNVTRLQAAIMFARALTGETDPTNAYWNKGLSQFSDVTEFQYAVTVAVNAGIINGMGDGTYNPTGDIQFIQALKMAVCALGYGEGLTWGADGMEYYNVAVDKGLTVGLDYITEAAKVLNRGEFAQLVYNMIYADKADGTGSIAYNVFKVGYVEPVEPEPVVEMTTFIITATDEQTAYEGMDVSEGGYVGMQALVAGAPEGDVIYVPVELLDIEEDEDEAYFLHAFNLANYDVETGAFDYVEATGNSWKIYNTEISDAKNFAAYSRFKYDGANFYTVEALSDNAIRNEVVLYNATDYGYNDGYELFLNADDEVMHPTDNKPVLQKVTSASGNVRYRVLVEDIEGTTYKKGDYITYEKALELFGQPIDGTELPYQIMKAGELTSAYELTVFDDDMDGKMDRAYWTPVYMSVYEGINSDKVHQTVGPLTAGKVDDDAGVVTGMEDLTKGDLFVYTYNEQLREVTVLDVLEAKEATVKKVNTTNQSEAAGTSVITLGDGTTLNLYNYDATNVAVDAKLGARVQKTQSPTYTDPNWIKQMTSGDFDFEYIFDEALLAQLKGGSLIRYYERNGILIFAETYNIEDVFERVILKEVNDADLEVIKADVYRNGAVEEIEISMIDGKAVSDISWIKLSTVLGNFASEAGKGNIYKISELEDGWQISTAFKDEDPTAADLKSFKLVQMTETTTDEDDAVVLGTKAYAKNIVINDNIAEIPDEARGVDKYNKYNRLRTNANTVWYFINRDKNGDATVKVFQGELEEAELAVDPDDTRIFVDALGYAGANKGTASVVYVYDAILAETTGFGWGEGDYSIAYVSVKIKDAHTWDYYEAGDAEELGLDAKVYDKNSYYKYASSYIMDMYTGKGVSIFSDKPLRAGNFYYINEDGYVVSDANAPLYNDDPKRGTIDYAYINYAGLDFDTNDYEIEDVDGNPVLIAEYEVGTFAVLAYNANSIKTSASDIKKIITDTDDGVMCYFLEGYADATDYADEDGRFAIVAGADLSVYEEEYEAPVDTKKTVTYNAQCTWGGTTYVAEFKNISTNAKRIDAVVTSVKEAIGDHEWGDEVKADIDAFTGDWAISKVEKTGTTNTDVTAKLVISDVEINDDGQLTFQIYNKQTNPTESKDIGAGTYIITITKGAANVVIYVKIS